MVAGAVRCAFQTPLPFCRAKRPQQMRNWLLARYTDSDGPLPFDLSYQGKFLELLHFAKSSGPDFGCCGSLAAVRGMFRDIWQLDIPRIGP